MHRGSRDGGIVYHQIQRIVLFSLPGRSPGRAIVLPTTSASALAAASALAKSLTLKFFYVMGKALSGKLSCPCDRYCSCHPSY